METLRDALRRATTQFAAVSESASLDAQVLLAEVLGQDRAYLLAHPEDELTDEQLERFNALVIRHAAGEPVAYLLGRRAWYDREFIVTPDVLIPRPETELLLEEALKYSPVNPPALTAVDVGTGSGALAVTFAALRPQATVYATDISPAALEVAQRNAALHGVNVRFFQGDLLHPLVERQVRVELFMANLPYIASAELEHLAVAKTEPRLALDGGVDGLRLIRRLMWEVRMTCADKGLLLLEIGAGQGAAVRTLAHGVAPKRVDVLRDYAGHERIVRVEL